MSRFGTTARRTPTGFLLGYALAVHATDLALLVELGEDGQALTGAPQVWIPKSQIHPDSEVYGTDRRSREGCLIVSLWLAKQNGWTEE